MTSGLRRGITVVACSLAMAAATPAANAEEDASYEAAITQGIAAREAGEAAHDLQKLNEALDLFQQALRIRVTAEAHYELARTAAALKEDDLAVEAYENAIVLGLGATATEKAKAYLAVHLGSMGRVTIVGPPGVRVLVRERWRGVLPLSKPIVVFAGLVQLRIIAQDGKTVDVELAVKAGELVSYDVAPRLAPKPSTSASTIVLSTHPEPLPDPGAAQRTWGIVVGATGVVAVSVGAYFGLRALSKRNERDSACASVSGGFCAGDPGVQSLHDDARRSALLADIGFGVGVVALGVGAYLLVSAPSAGERGPSPTTATMRLDPLLAKQGGGLSLAWSW
jgi:hypothetical protein